MAALTGDILALLDKIPIWKRLQETPARVDALEKRIAELELRLEKAPGLDCPACGARDLRQVKEAPDPMFGDMGVKIRTMECKSCGHVEERQTNP